MKLVPDLLDIISEEGPTGSKVKAIYREASDHLNRQATGMELTSVCSCRRVRMLPGVRIVTASSVRLLIGSTIGR